MYRARLFSCGLCGNPMKPVTLAGEGVNGGNHDQVVVDLCESCPCVFIEYFDGEPATIARALRQEPLMQASALGKIPVSNQPDNAEPKCPECNIPLQLMLYLDDGPPVHRCDQCMAILATAEQIAALAQFEQTEKKQKEEERDGLFAFLRQLFY